MNADHYDCDAADEDEWEGSRWFRDLPSPEPPSGLRERVMASITAYERRRRIRRTARRIGGIAVALLLGLLIAISRQRRMNQCKTTMVLGMAQGRKRKVHAPQSQSYTRRIHPSTSRYP